MLARAQLIVLLALSFGAESLVVFAQDDDRYQEEYDRVTQIAKVTDPARRAEQMVAFYKTMPNPDPRIKPYADNLFKQDLNTLMTQQRTLVVKKLSESALTVRPKFAEALFFYGVILKTEKKYEEATIALAKSYVLSSSLKDDAKKQLDLVYRAAHNGSIVGEDKLIKQIEAEMK
jgi:hypothetical protein